MNNNIHSKLNFETILDYSKKNFQPFEKEVKVERRPIDFESSLKKVKNKGKNAIISEIKYSSPTTGANLSTKSPQELATQMKNGGASAISVLTESRFFKGSLENLRKVKNRIDLPVLRKDFIFHRSQIPQSYYYGADSLLLISSLLRREVLKSLIEDSRSYGMEPLIEVHDLKDIEKSGSSGAKLYVINNRNKDSLIVDIKRTAQMAPKISGFKISASGINTPDQLRKVLRHADAALIGSSIMNAPNITLKVKEFTEA